MRRGNRRARSLVLAAGRTAAASAQRSVVQWVLVFRDAVGMLRKNTNFQLLAHVRFARSSRAGDIHLRAAV